MTRVLKPRGDDEEAVMLNYGEVEVNYFCILWAMRNNALLLSASVERWELLRSVDHACRRVRTVW